MLSYQEDIGVARREIRQTAQRMNMGEQAVAELELIASEMGSNIVNYGTEGGLLCLEILDGDRPAGIQILAHDRGPGIGDIELALSDYYSSRGSMGCGLGAIKRLSDEFDIYSHTGTYNSYIHTNDYRGTIILSRKWRKKENKTRSSVDYYAYSRPLPGFAANGDAYFVAGNNDRFFLAVLDGLGHGEYAQAASQAAVAWLRQHWQSALETSMTELHRALSHTRGAAALLIDLRCAAGELSYLGVGNVEARVYRAQERQETILLSDPGIVGYGRLPTLNITGMAWHPDSVLVAFTDGIAGRWNLNHVPAIFTKDPAIIGHLIMQGFAKSQDDSTVVIVKQNP